MELLELFQTSQFLDKPLLITETPTTTYIVGSDYVVGVGLQQDHIKVGTHYVDFSQYIIKVFTLIHCYISTQYYATILQFISQLSIDDKLQVIELAYIVCEERKTSFDFVLPPKVALVLSLPTMTNVTREYYQCAYVYINITTDYDPIQSDEFWDYYIHYLSKTPSYKYNKGILTVKNKGKLYDIEYNDHEFNLITTNDIQYVSYNKELYQFDIGEIDIDITPPNYWRNIVDTVIFSCKYINDIATKDNNILTYKDITYIVDVCTNGINKFQYTRRSIELPTTILLKQLC